MMAVALAALGEGASVRGVARLVEHFSRCAIASDAIAARIARVRQLAPIFAIFSLVLARKPLCSQEQKVENGL
jgi:uncharacterized membrane protein YadS